jgi:hypothetical protein
MQKVIIIAEPFGNLVRAITLADYLHTAVMAMVDAEKDDGVLAAQIRGHGFALRRFAVAFSKRIEMGMSTEEIETFCRDMCYSSAGPISSANYNKQNTN